MSKTVLIGADAREKMKEGVDILSNAVKATLGPRGRHAAIERKVGPPIITKDGVTVARYIDLEDRIQNMGAQLVKSVASDANNEAGDGTTTATVLAQEIYNRGLSHINNGTNPVLLKRGIDFAITKVVENIKTISIAVHDEKSLAQVATISANNDSHLGQMIAEAITAVGNDGMLIVEEAVGNVTEVQYTEGIKLERGWLSESFVTNFARNTCELDAPYILVYDDDIKSIHQLVPLLNQIIDKGSHLFIVAKNIESEALAHIVLNVLNKAIRCCVIKAPGFGDYRRALMEDIAVQTGAKVITSASGHKLETTTLKDLGQARSVIVGTNITKIIDGVARQEKIEEVKNILRDQLLDENIFDHQKEIISQRISRLGGAVATFKVGATSEGELREKKDRIEDAINAVRSALVEGVVPGGGCALLRSVKILEELDISNFLQEEVLGIDVVKHSLRAPFVQILKNAGVDNYEYCLEKIYQSGNFSGFDALRLEHVDDMLERGIIDPAKVVRVSLEHAASASGTLLTTEVLICEKAITK